jgi:hypothetical protein
VDGFAVIVCFGRGQPLSSLWTGPMNQIMPDKSAAGIQSNMIKGLRLGGRESLAWGRSSSNIKENWSIPHLDETK